MDTVSTARSTHDPAGSPGPRLDSPLALPPSPPDEPRAGFPWLASGAPVVGAFALWALTGSPLALAFAALGPVVALASMIDGRRHAAARRRRGSAERLTALDELQREIARRHADERAQAWRRMPSAASVLQHAPGADWRGEGPGSVVIGRGDEPSTLRIGGSPTDDADRAVLRFAGQVSDAPVAANPVGGLGFVGPPPLTRAAARAALVQLMRHATPGVIAVRVPDASEWRWAISLPHRSGAETILVTDADAAPAGPADPAPTGAAPDDPALAATWRIATALVPADLPPGLGTVVRLEHPGRAILERDGGRPAERVVVPELLSVADAASWAEATRAAAVRAGLADGLATIPAVVPVESLVQPAARRSERSTLAVTVGVGASGAVQLDLVRDGPHALVAGTSGSGKSEFLLAWLTALAAVHPTGLVSFLLVDFKGGAAFEPLRGLPHVAGLVTDLDEAEAVRAIQSLRAELRHREEVIRAAGRRSIAELPTEVELPRLVIVVDEFQAMVERFPDLAPLIGDIASRGRSLGVHLVLAAQRPNGVVRESVTANCGLRVSLRVLHRADSLAVVGVEDAAGLDPSAPGRALVARDGRATEFQSALASPAALERVRRGAVGGPVRRPWLDPLPPRLAVSALVDEDIAPRADGELAFGLADDPEHQRRELAVWHPERDGSVLVAGSPGSGRSTALGAIARAFADAHGDGAVVVLGGPPSTEWDAVHDELARVRAGRSGRRLLVVDDLDARYRSWPDEPRQILVEMLAALGREGRAGGLFVAASATAALTLPGPVRELFGASVLLRHAGRSEVVQAGGIGALWRADEPPGAGQWRGRRIQVVESAAPRPPDARPVPPLALAAGVPAAVVSSAPAHDADALTAALGREVLVLRHGDDAATRALRALHDPGAPAPVVVADADAWSANWTLLAAIQERGVCVVRGGPAELRCVIRDRVCPPVLDPGRPQCWRVVPGEGPVRFGWPPRPAHGELAAESAPQSTNSS
ncbi:FtsK/SpoIIIE domain-containing protein [Agromyces aerolatus]|uniref:FtsK/SpoIIIE domain-containing protein n=1 Tax=Agromyces sp. LY-1074 TaxID=3074080 RepID=UPI0028631108|nr:MULTISPECIES: FtsK/SpoIIIE domain-containing protein [unclassified Agromyces]MDR5701311.1 FtsK/SpoIIIE domain-containing protein [Agromyces sp. LY-1074]MDR5707569.1 FtsK/SpoIIIE domain-containing protein [Agromyces sp. LY-1358]